MGACVGHNTMMGGVCCERGQLLMIGQSSIIPPGKSVGSLRQCAVFCEHIRCHCSTVLG